MPVQQEVKLVRRYQLTENKFGVAKYPICTEMMCREEAQWVVHIYKLDHTFQEPKCDEHVKLYPVGAVISRARPSSYMTGLAQFFGMDVRELVDLPADDRAVLQKFADAYRKDDMDACTLIIKENKTLIKKYFKPEEH